MKDIPVGYKQTEVGVIPEDWDVVLLQRLVEKVDYGSAAKSKPSGKVPVLRMGNLDEGGVTWDDLVYTDSQEEIEKYRLHVGDVLFNRTNTIDLVGKTSIYLSQREAIFAGYLIRIRTKKEALSSEYLNYFMNTSVVKKRNKLVLSVAVGQANINGQKLKAYPVPLPLLPEQRAIATALSDVDALLGALDRLIAKKRDLKQAAMQQLLTGQTRLPGFSGEWGVKRLGDFGRCLRGVSYKGDSDLSSHDTHHTKRLLRSNNVQNSIVVTEEVQFVNAERVSLHQILRQDDILICMANGSKSLVGKAGIFMLSDGHEYTFGAFMGCFRTNFADANPAFVFYLFLTARYRDYINNLLAGSSINNLRPSSIESLEFLTPPLPEQTAIAAVLSDMDAELSALERRREKTRALKQAMMQELLTGRIRLVPQGGANA
jgi:type I restriction enzyme S subunit